MPDAESKKAQYTTRLHAHTWEDGTEHKHAHSTSLEAHGHDGLPPLPDVEVLEVKPTWAAWRKDGK